ncbi:regulatory protein RecX [Cohnella panacarvi]|uniref:regulatory protein RecX n=1 Tax=Cohnella panacarvi TaxID=400776 RepID=UPI000478D500|nr:regulatory protein RecX [Cohnella panacarvi]
MNGKRTGRSYDYRKAVEEQQEAATDPRTVIGATVVSVEAHLRRSMMYRITLKLEYEEDTDPDLTGYWPKDAEDTYSKPIIEKSFESWTDEVDALIASAQTATEPGEAVLTIHEDTLVGWRLLKGKQLTAGEYAKLLEEEQKEEAYRAALGMLERKARTTAELSRALKRKGFAQEAIAGCMERLRTNRMVDDSAFARRFAEQRAANQRKGRMLIRQELLQRGVAKPEIEQAIGAIEPEIEQQSALALARKKWPSVKGNDRERKQKLMAMLMRRGYTGSVARSAAQQAASETDGGRHGDDDAEWIDSDYDETFE